MSPFVLAVLKYALLALLYFFIFRTIRAVTSDLSGGRRVARPKAEPRTPRAARSGKAKPPTLVVVHSDDGRKLGKFPLSTPLQIGQAESCHIRLHDTYVSQLHARLFGQGTGWYVEDLGSTNGTYLNRDRVTAPAEVHPGDKVRVGKTILELRR